MDIPPPRYRGASVRLPPPAGVAGGGWRLRVALAGGGWRQGSIAPPIAVRRVKPNARPMERNARPVREATERATERKAETTETRATRTTGAGTETTGAETIGARTTGAGAGAAIMPRDEARRKEGTRFHAMKRPVRAHRARCRGCVADSPSMARIAFTGTR